MVIGRPTQRSSNMSHRIRQGAMIAIIGGSLGLAAQTQAAQILLNSNFNGSTTGWTLTNGGGTVADTGTESTFTNAPSGASVDIKDTTTTTTANKPTITAYYAALNSGETNNPVQISFDVNLINRGAGENCSLIVSSSTGVREIILNISDGATGKVSYVGSSAVQLGTTLNLSKWYHFTLTAPPAVTSPTSWDLSISDGTTTDTYKGLTFRNPVTNYNGQQFTMNNGAVTLPAEFQVDNVLVQTVPEPTSMAAMAAAGMGLLCVRRRRA